MTTREDIDRALAEWDDSLAPPDAEEYFVSRRTMVATVQAARRGRLLFPSVCQTCGGSGEDIQQSGTRAFTIPCPSCGGSGKEWDEVTVRTLMAALVRWEWPDDPQGFELNRQMEKDFQRGAKAVLDALAALEVNE